jgi:hypothetical protein
MVEEIVALQAGGLQVEETLESLRVWVPQPRFPRWLIPALTQFLLMEVGMSYFVYLYQAAHPSIQLMHIGISAFFAGSFGLLLRGPAWIQPPHLGEITLTDHQLVLTHRAIDLDAIEGHLCGGAARTYGGGDGSRRDAGLCGLPRAARPAHPPAHRSASGGTVRVGRQHGASQSPSRSSWIDHRPDPDCARTPHSLDGWHGAGVCVLTEHPLSPSVAVPDGPPATARDRSHRRAVRRGRRRWLPALRRCSGRRSRGSSPP